MTLKPTQTELTARARADLRMGLPVVLEIGGHAGLVAAAETGKCINVKKGQFVAPGDVTAITEKIENAGNSQILVTERGASFGYNNLVSDMRSIAIIKETGYPVVFDATHSAQLPGGQGSSSGGQREMVPVLARAATGVGIHGLFMETHPDPENALSDGPNSWPLGQMHELLSLLKQIDAVIKSSNLPEEAEK